MSIKRSSVLLAATLLLCSAATAHEEATGIVKERMDLMERQRDDMKIIGDMAKEKTPFDAAKAGAAARDIGETSKKIPELFPEGSGGHPSEALPSVWQDFDRFSKLAGDLETKAQALDQAIAGGGDWKPQFHAVTDGCKACHQDFRAKKKN